MDRKYHVESKLNALYPNEFFIFILLLSVCIVWMWILLPTFDAENGGSRYVRNCRHPQGAKTQEDNEQCTAKRIACAAAAPEN
jgi:hypothetical protein